MDCTMKYCPPMEGNTETQLFQYHPISEDNTEIQKIYSTKYIMSVLGLDSGYMVKYSRTPLRVP